MNSTEMRLEDQLRRKLRKSGYLLRKSRERTVNPDNLGGYMIVDGYTNAVAAGGCFDLSLDDVERFCNEE